MRIMGFGTGLRTGKGRRDRGEEQGKERVRNNAEKG